jgi:hypothetical protein
MMRKSIQNGLPAIALLFDRVSWLSVKCLSHGDPAGGSDELHQERPVTKRTFERGVFDDLRVGAREIETHAAVFSFHARRKCTPFPQIDYCNLHSQSPWLLPVSF